MIDATADGLGRFFRVLSRARGKRAFHPYGVGFRVALEPRGPGSGASAFDRPAEGVVRLSRALGLPEWAPDPCGFGLRVVDAHGSGRHQDLLLVSSGSRRATRHALLPSRGFADRPYSSILPYRLAGDLVVVGARALAPRPGPLLTDLAEHDFAGLRFELALARLGGEWQPLSTVSLLARLGPGATERLALDPGNTGGGLALAGVLNRLRVPSYRGSQSGRETGTGEGSARPGAGTEEASESTVHGQAEEET